MEQKMSHKEIVKNLKLCVLWLPKGSLSVGVDFTKYNIIVS
jgi:hypothetical protein